MDIVGQTKPDDLDYLDLDLQLIIFKDLLDQFRGTSQYHEDSTLIDKMTHRVKIISDIDAPNNRLLGIELRQQIIDAINDRLEYCIKNIDKSKDKLRWNLLKIIVWFVLSNFLIFILKVAL